MKFKLTSWPICGVPGLVYLNSTKGSKKNFLSFSKANVGSSDAFTIQHAICKMTLPAKTAKLGSPDANDIISEGYNFP